jgi:diaminopimelate decarboxylase
MNKLNQKIFLEISKENNSFYFFDRDKFILNHNELLKSFKNSDNDVRLAYSYKTNYLPYIAEIVNSLGSFAEIVSSMEYKIAKKSGVIDKNIFFNGPIKDTASVCEILSNGGTVNFDSYHDYQKVNWSLFNTTVNIGVRINLFLPGKFSRFGVDTNDQEFIQLIDEINNNPKVNLRMIHFHLPERTINDWKEKFNLYYKVIEQIHPKINFELISIGGGFYSKMDKKTLKSIKIQTRVKFSDYGHLFTQFEKKLFNLTGKKYSFIIEPGTALVANTFDFITKIYSIKKIHNSFIASTYGSSFNTNPNNRKIRLPYSVLKVKSIQKTTLVNNCRFSGFTCIEDDYLVDNFNGRLNLDSLLVIHNCGSYSIVMKPPFILMNCPIYTVENNKVVIVKKEDAFENIFESYVFKN